MKTNSEVLAFLLDIKAKVKEAYPFPADTDIDSRFAFALGIILGVAEEAVTAVANKRKMRGDVTYVRLDEKEFEQLVSGKVVEMDRVKIILADIGFSQMKAIINKAIG